MNDEEKMMEGLRASFYLGQRLAFEQVAMDYKLPEISVRYSYAHTMLAQRAEQGLERIMASLHSVGVGEEV